MVVWFGMVIWDDLKMSILVFKTLNVEHYYFSLRNLCIFGILYFNIFQLIMFKRIWPSGVIVYPGNSNFKCVLALDL